METRVLNGIQYFKYNERILAKEHVKSCALRDIVKKTCDWTDGGRMMDKERVQ